ncbi:AlkA N-terminal domain-containing protein [Sandaracinus amylolyticus]|uniref:AlkA N-terminal domain-containing protein n=1 Tax=Sandaracinus amylolyticus TaxID=927083 RepID=UPI001F0142B6|nr:AlkA N-terminal domain-containing protein [Sandaracinus amylolyticus]
MTLDADTCYRALVARDPRFDGVFFVGVETTGIYCRPVCRARTPGRDRCTFHRSAASAERAGFRACLRCRPELAPGDAPIDSVPRLVARAVARLDEAARGEVSVAAIANDLGVSDRHLRRAIEAELGVSPRELVASRRLAIAKQLVVGSSLSLAQVAFASGYGSVRRFNDAFRARFARTPTALRAGRARESEGVVTLHLGVRVPFAWSEALAFLASRALPGLEWVEGDAWHRAVRIEDRAGVIRASSEPARAMVRVEIPTALAPHAMTIASRVRAVLDLDAAPARIDETLAADPSLRRAVARRPGLRVPGAWDGFELAVRAILGQQVSVAAARTLAARIVVALGPAPIDGALAFPDPSSIVRGGPDRLSALGVLPARARSIVALARAVDEGGLRLDRGADPEATMAALQTIEGVGPWTASYVAMRALRWPDALPASDLVLKKRLGVKTEGAVRAHAERWRPWRAYGVMHVWARGEEE